MLDKLLSYLTSSKVGISTADFTWVPLACLMLAAFSANLGAAPVPWILSVEYFPTAIRSQVMGVSTMIGNLISFAALQAYSPMQAAFTQAGLYWSYACVAALGIVYTLCFVQETKGPKESTDNLSSFSSTYADYSGVSSDMERLPCKIMMTVLWK
ncbi:facilitated trehalose transporter Tret1-2 homolog [Penaeus chinensis]|uniref:facilitated trehalose transporter Tret1-2 homolog n=1 Tax=Penaeus chinensis TaxID=139456 RepID=UPI001FB66F9F|nr:facilitated trehalose transporter Tret1-2 homolog [Penaeus chinensis]